MLTHIFTVIGIIATVLAAAYVLVGIYVAIGLRYLR